MIHAQAVKTVLVTPPAAIVDNAGLATAAIDTLGFDYLTVKVLLGATDIAMAALKLQECDTSGGVYADIAGANFATAPATLPAATDDNGIFTFFVDLKGKKRFIDVVATGGDGTAGAYVVIVAELSRGSITPSDATSRGHVQELFV